MSWATESWVAWRPSFMEVMEKSIRLDPCHQPRFSGWSSFVPLKIPLLMGPWGVTQLYQLVYCTGEFWMAWMAWMRHSDPCGMSFAPWVYVKGLFLFWSLVELWLKSIKSFCEWEPFQSTIIPDKGCLPLWGLGFVISGLDISIIPVDLDGGASKSFYDFLDNRSI